MPRPALLLALCACALVAALLAGCGGRSADLFAVDRAGDVPGAKLRLIVNDGGTTRCNGGGELELPPKLLIEARELERELRPPAEAGLTLKPGQGSVLRYDVHLADGSLRFADDSAHRPPALNRLVLFVRQVAQGVCKLAR